ncbi:MAG: NAD(P)-binding protein [Leptospiraceae bacterium]|nr:NAD(P)-binding protein [Leptospiraceae bacterium]
MADKKKIVVLGSGLGSLSTVFNLTKDPSWKEKYEITVYQMGWRLGGKCASSRNRSAAGRIEEHGIHIFGNFYSNAFHSIKDCLEELKAAPEETIKTMDDAFFPDNFASIFEFDEGKFKRWPTYLPHNDEKPWDKGYLPQGEDVILEIVQLTYSLFFNSELPEEDESIVKGLLDKIISGLQNSVGIELKNLGRALVTKALELANEYSNTKEPGILIKIIEILDKARDWVWDLIGKIAESSDYFRRIYIQLDYYITILRGIVIDGVLIEGIEQLDDIDYRDWLIKHGISDLSINSPLPQIPINICFQYPDGNSDSLPKMSASGYLTFFLRQIVAKGAPIYHFKAGTGETIISPFYRVLKDRGVKFEFFHKVKNLKVNKDGNSIESIEIEKQATVKDGEYSPIFYFKGMYSWPEEPFFEQLKEGKELKDKNINLESYWTDWNGVDNIKLKKDKDFDLIVFGLSLGAVPYIASELVENNIKWKNAVNKIKTIRTQAFQIWLKPSMKELGWDEKMHGHDFLVGASYVSPFQDVSDFSDLIELEDWKEEKPETLLYFCGPLEEPLEPTDFSDTNYPKMMENQVKWTAIQSLRTNILAILPKAINSPLDKWGLDFDLLACHDPRNAGVGVNRFNQQFVRANIDPTERYVLSYPGSEKFRLEAWNSGFDNLIPTGDWIDTGLNVGSAEGSFISGMLASHTIVGSPKLEEIDGYYFLKKIRKKNPDPKIN